MGRRRSGPAHAARARQGTQPRPRRRGPRRARRRGCGAACSRPPPSGSGHRTPRTRPRHRESPTTAPPHRLRQTISPEFRDQIERAAHEHASGSRALIRRGRPVSRPTWRILRHAPLARRRSSPSPSPRARSQPSEAGQPHDIRVTASGPNQPAWLSGSHRASPSIAEGDPPGVELLHFEPAPALSRPDDVVPVPNDGSRTSWPTGPHGIGGHHEIAPHEDRRQR